MLNMRVVHGAAHALQWLGNSMTSSGAEYLQAARNRTVIGPHVHRKRVIRQQAEHRSNHWPRDPRQALDSTCSTMRLLPRPASWPVRGASRLLPGGRPHDAGCLLLSLAGPAGNVRFAKSANLSGAASGLARPRAPNRQGTGCQYRLKRPPIHSLPTYRSGLPAADPSPEGLRLPRRLQVGGPHLSAAAGSVRSALPSAAHPALASPQGSQHSCCLHGMLPVWRHSKL